MHFFFLFNKRRLTVHPVCRFCGMWVNKTHQDPMVSAWQTTARISDYRVLGKSVVTRKIAMKTHTTDKDLQWKRQS